ncbi:MAG: hypothetical protein JZD41_02305 [Thermoproteus sp.]|nr:hypothetical protein [Thermoproteus sp.]
MMLEMIAFYVAIMAAIKLIGKLLKRITVFMASDLVKDIADKYGYLGHGTLGYIVAILLAQSPILAAIVAFLSFLYYEIIHYLIPDARVAVLEFMIVYVATTVYINKIPLYIH